MQSAMQNTLCYLAAHFSMCGHSMLRSQIRWNLLRILCLLMGGHWRRRGPGTDRIPDSMRKSNPPLSSSDMTSRILFCLRLLFDFRGCGMSRKKGKKKRIGADPDVRAKWRGKGERTGCTCSHAYTKRRNKFKRPSTTLFFFAPDVCVCGSWRIGSYFLFLFVTFTSSSIHT